MSFNAIRENKILAKISGSTVTTMAFVRKTPLNWYTLMYQARLSKRSEPSTSMLCVYNN